MDRLFLRVCSLSLSVGLLTLGLLVLRRLLMRRYTARWRCWVWLVLALRLALPLPLPLSIRSFHFTCISLGCGIPQ